METPKIKIDLKAAPWLECNCGSKTFIPRMMVKRISPIMSGSAQEELIPIEFVVCEKCGKIPSFMYEKLKGILPEEIVRIQEYVSELTQKSNEVLD